MNKSRLKLNNPLYFAFDSETGYTMNFKQLISFLILPLLLTGCGKKYTPKPRGYFRIEFPEKKYQLIDEGFPYKFDIPVYSSVKPDMDKLAEPYWVNVLIPENKAQIHISYKKINPSDYHKFTNEKESLTEARKIVLAKYIEESRKLAYKHAIKADAIEERIFLNPASKVYGTIYLIEGNAASPIQFYLTDSISHFLRGALYISEVPNIDSLKPVINFLEPDVIRLIESTTWN
ncbi:GldD [hydrothermal vent metagenome]|uniref:GldD n=1 Tax=hydrothermal vent metagenome TaxID=652676 RepID=A0A3B0T0Z2_9ZZZZ